MLHAALAQLFATSEAHATVPMQPFAVDDLSRERDAMSGRHDRIPLLGYSPLDEAALASRFGPAGRELVREIVTKEVAPIPAGTVLQFRVRVRPTVRTKRPDPQSPQPRTDKRGKPKARELDAWLAERLQDWRATRPSEWSEDFDVFDDRERAYTGWLDRELIVARPSTGRENGARCAELLETEDLGTGRPRRARMVELRREPFFQGGARGERPNVVLEGTLRVTDADAFRALLARGVGRHRAFGFGMLLLRRA
jgi:CRISPR system Cascade subunit CasE